MNAQGTLRTLLPVGLGGFLLAGAGSASAQSVWLPPVGRVQTGVQYVFETYSELFGARRQTVRLRDDVNQHTVFLTGEYGLSPHWALDATLGFVTTETRAFGPAFSTDSGLADSRVGVRHCLLNEFEVGNEWLPTVTLRAGGIIAGTYEYLSPAGDGASGMESSFLVGKVLPAWGIGLHSEVGYRVRENPVPDEYFAVMNVFKRFDDVVLSAGVRHTQAVSGLNLGGGRPFWPRLKEVTDQFEGSLGWVSGSWTTQIFSAYVFNGKNTPTRLVMGVGVQWGF